MSRRACSSLTTTTPSPNSTKEARSHLAASQRLNGPTLESGQRVFQAGDRILCRRNQDRLGVLNGDLGTVLTVNTDHGALTGHKAQGVTTGRTFTVITGGTDREWAYVAMSRGRHANTLYLANPEPDDEGCTHLTHPERRDALDALAASLGRSAAQTAAIDPFAGGRPLVGAGVDTLGPPPPSSDVAERAAWIAARRHAERNELKLSTRGVELAAER